MLTKAPRHSTTSSVAGREEAGRTTPEQWTPFFPTRLPAFFLLQNRSATRLCRKTRKRDLGVLAGAGRESQYSFAVQGTLSPLWCLCQIHTAGVEGTQATRFRLVARGPQHSRPAGTEHSSGFWISPAVTPHTGVQPPELFGRLPVPDKHVLCSHGSSGQARAALCTCLPLTQTPFLQRGLSLPELFPLLACRYFPNTSFIFVCTDHKHNRSFQTTQVIVFGQHEAFPRTSVFDPGVAKWWHSGRGSLVGSCWGSGSSRHVCPDSEVCTVGLGGSSRGPHSSP